MIINQIIIMTELIIFKNNIFNDLILFVDFFHNFAIIKWSDS